MKVELDLVKFSHRGGWEFCLVCRSAPGGEPTPGTLAYYALGYRVCDRCVELGPEHIREAIRKRGEQLRREAAIFQEAAAENVEIPDISLEDRAKMELWGERHIQNHFGVCPVCGKDCAYLNVGRDHWFYCDEHEVCWYVGSSLFSSWRQEDEETWRQNEEKLAPFRVVYRSALEDLDLILTGDALRAAERRVADIAPEDINEFPF
jgi:hypothetical protein